MKTVLATLFLGILMAVVSTIDFASDSFGKEQANEPPDWMCAIAPPMCDSSQPPKREDD